MSQAAGAIGAAALLWASSAAAGDLAGQVGVDFFRADSVSPGPEAGAPATLRYHELGVQAQLGLREVDDRLRLDVDYRGQEPLQGEVQAQARRLLYRGEIAFAVVPDLLTLGAGRFVPKAAVFVPTDGAWVELALPGQLRLRAYGGRRGVTSSRRNLDFERFLPALGGSVGWSLDPWLQVAVDGGWSEDQALAAVQSDGDLRRRYGAAHLQATAQSRPLPSLCLGAQGAFLQRAGFVLGPDWRTLQVAAEAFDLFRAAAWAEWRPLAQLRLQYDVLAQRAAAYKAGRLDGASAAGVVDPDFIDNRWRVAWAPFELGWIRVAYRLRLRPDRLEHRASAEVQADDLWVPGLYASGRVAYDAVVPQNAGVVDHDRLLWAAALGWRGYGLEIEAGASFLERAAPPVSGRLADPLAPDEPRTPLDLSPFVLEAQRVLFARAYYSQRWLFAGVDFERNLEDDEMRLLVQVGSDVDLAW